MGQGVPKVNKVLVLCEREEGEAAFVEQQDRIFKLSILGGQMRPPSTISTTPDFLQLKEEKTPQGRKLRRQYRNWRKQTHSLPFLYILWVPFCGKGQGGRRGSIVY